VRSWWAALLPQRRRAILVGAALFCIATFSLVVVAPLHDAEAVARRRTDAAEALQIRMRDAALEAAAIRQRSGIKASASLDRPLLALVEASSRDFMGRGAIERIGLAGAGAVQVQIAEGPFEKVIGWLDHLDSEHAVRVEQAMVSATRASGMVRAELILRRP